MKTTKTTKKVSAKAVAQSVEESVAKVEKTVAEKLGAVKKKVASKKTAVKEAVQRVAEKVEQAEKAVKTAKTKAAKTISKTAVAATKATTAAKAATSKTVAAKATKTTKQTTVKQTPKQESKVAEKPVAPSGKTPAAKTLKVSKPAKSQTASIETSFNPEYLVLMQKDPNWMHAFWEVSEERLKAASKGKSKVVLRLFDISKDLTVRKNKMKRFRDVVVPANARSWYIENTAQKECVAVLGTVSGKTFTPIVESEQVLTFDANVSAPAADNAFVKASLGGATLGNFMSSGFSSQTAKSWLESLRLGSSSESMFSGALSSAALQSNEIAVPKDSVNYGKDFFLWVKTRLIVYGGTRPDAHLQVRGEPFPLNPDGTFSFEEDLPDSTKVIPVFATDKDGDFPTTIVPIVVKRTE